MTIKERFQQQVSMTVLQRQCMIIVTLLATIGALTAWPRFHSDAMSLEWPVYLVLAAFFAIPLFKKN